MCWGWRETTTRAGLEECRDNPQNNAIGEAPDGRRARDHPAGKETLTLAQAEEKNIVTQDGTLRLLAQTYADVDDMGGIYMMLALVENTTDSELTGWRHVLSSGSMRREIGWKRRMTCAETP